MKNTWSRAETGRLERREHSDQNDPDLEERNGLGLRHVAVGSKEGLRRSRSAFDPASGAGGLLHAVYHVTLRNHRVIRMK